MRPGDLVEFKDSLFGIKAPQNLGIFLERRKHKKDFFVVLVTVKGVREVKPEQVTARRFHANVDTGVGEEGLVARLKDLIGEAQGGRLDQRQAEDDSLTERRLWELTVNDVSDPETPEALAARVTEGTPTKGDVRRVTEILDRCKRPGTGFFERRDRGRWMPVSVADFKGFQRGLEAANRVRKKLVRIVAVEDDSGETWERLEGIPVAAAGLDDEERALLAAYAEGMRSYVMYDGWRDDVTPPGTSVHTLEGQQYHRVLENLARDWTDAFTVSRSSAMVQFLVDAAGMSVQDAIRLIARRKVIAAPGFDWATPEELERWSERYQEPGALHAADPQAYAHRRDLRGMACYTIDPPDAKDFDDAVSIRTHDDGSAELWVHIADVSAYVEKDSRLDHHARERATSVYLPTGVLPMLPSRLSDDLCSLREAVDRFAMSVRIEVDPQGAVTAWEPMESVIRVTKNHHYGQVDAAIVRGEEPFLSLHTLAERMRTHRRGLDIETGELRIRFAEEEAARAARREGLAEGDAPAEDDAPDATGLTIQIKHASPATKMIEAFMVAANEAVSRFVAEHGAAVPYRCHPLPERGKTERFQAQARVLGLDVRLELPEEGPADGAEEADEDEEAGGSILDQLKGGKLQLGGFAASETIGSRKEPEEEVAPAGPQTDLRPTLRGLAQLTPELQEAWLAPFRKALEAVEAVEDDGLRALAYMKVLSTLGRALYTPRNLGHFGLGSTSYAHFTSPIRRYPDLVLHRQLRWLLRKNAGLDVPDTPPHYAEHLDSLTDHCTGQTETAERLERGLLDCCMTFESRREAWTKGLSGVVSGVTAGGVFLSLPGNLEARLGVRDIPGGPYEVDENSSYLFRARLPGGAVAAEDDADDLLGVDWRELEDPETGELREVRIKLGDRLRVAIRERDFVDGKVAVRLTSG